MSAQVVKNVGAGLVLQTDLHTRLRFDSPVVQITAAAAGTIKAAITDLLPVDWADPDLRLTVTFYWSRTELPTDVDVDPISQGWRKLGATGLDGSQASVPPFDPSVGMGIASIIGSFFFVRVVQTRALNYGATLQLL